MREWTPEELRKAEEQATERFFSRRAHRIRSWNDAKDDLIAAQCRINVLREALEEFLEGIDPDCGDPDCYDCKAYRTVRQALRDTAPKGE